MLELKKSHHDQTQATDKIVQNLVRYTEVLFFLAFFLQVRETRLNPFSEVLNNGLNITFAQEK